MPSYGVGRAETACQGKWHASELVQSKQGEHQTGIGRGEELSREKEDIAIWVSGKLLDRPKLSCITVF